MSEQEKPKSTFMQELDQWSRNEVIDPLLYAGAGSAEDDSFDWEGSAEQAMKAIRAKVRESYHNGLAAGQRGAPAPQRPPQPRPRYLPKAEVHQTPWR
jgi:hypothetical protein